MSRKVMLFSLLTVAIALPARHAAAEPTPSATTVAWELSFQPAPLMKISVDTGSGSATYWYLLYTVTNNTGQDIDFHPEIVRVSEMENETPADKAAAHPDTAPTIKAEPAIVGVDARVFKAISERHSRTHPFLITPVKAIDRLLQGKDNARTSVAVFTDLDPRISKFTIYVGGLSGERVSRPNPKHDPRKSADSEENQKLFVLQKTLALPFTLPGDPRTRGAAVPAMGRMNWVMR
ncbi:MAG: hypothetical protein AABZ08_04175 [Planctomycetota bacterium]